MAPKQFLNKKGGNTRPYTPLPFPCDNKKSNKTVYEKKILRRLLALLPYILFISDFELYTFMLMLKFDWVVLVVRVSALIKETIIFEGLYRRHLYREFEEVRQFVFECISSLINVLFPLRGSSAKSFIFCVLPAFPPGLFALTVSLCNWLFGIIFVLFMLFYERIYLLLEGISVENLCFVFFTETAPIWYL